MHRRGRRAPDANSGDDVCGDRAVCPIAARRVPGAGAWGLVFMIYRIVSYIIVDVLYLYSFISAFFTIIRRVACGRGGSWIELTFRR